jgi:hypothetical protein
VSAEQREQLRVSRVALPPPATPHRDDGKGYRNARILSVTMKYFRSPSTRTLANAQPFPEPSGLSQILADPAYRTDVLAVGPVVTMSGKSRKSESASLRTTAT